MLQDGDQHTAGGSRFSEPHVVDRLLTTDQSSKYADVTLHLHCFRSCHVMLMQYTIHASTTCSNLIDCYGQQVMAKQIIL